MPKPLAAVGELLNRLKIATTDARNSLRHRGRRTSNTVRRCGWVGPMSPTPKPAGLPSSVYVFERVEPCVCEMGTVTRLRSEFGI